MKIRAFAPAFVVGVLFYLAPTWAQAQCRAADTTSALMIEKYQGLMRSTDPNVRTSLSQDGIPLVDPNTITLVTDRTVCSKAEKAFAAYHKGSTISSSGSVYVLRVGAVYIVRDPGRTSGEWVAEAVLDSQFKVISAFLT